MNKTTLLVLVLTTATGFACVKSKIGVRESHKSSLVDEALESKKVALGESLFFDPRLSLDRTVSCGSCHVPLYGFASPYRVTPGVFGREGDRNAPATVNRGIGQRQFWDARASSLEDQLNQTLRNHSEMDMSDEVLSTRIQEDPKLVESFMRVFASGAMASNAKAALVAFVQSIEAYDSDYDRYVSGELSALNDKALAGKELFFNKYKCSVCHSGSNFTNEKLSPPCYPFIESPLMAKVAKNTRQLGQLFKTPTLRNVEVTGPYLHNGKLKKLRHAIEFYENTGPVPDEFVGHEDFQVPVVKFQPGEVEQLEAFLRTLTGRVRYGSPLKEIDLRERRQP